MNKNQNKTNSTKMNKSTLSTRLAEAALVVIALLVAYVVLFAPSAHLSQDFPGGIQPSNLWSANSATNSVSPISTSLQNIYTTGALSAGGVGTYNQISAYVTASGTPIAVYTLGTLGQTSSTATTTITVPNTSGLSIGSICSGGSSVTSTYVSGCTLFSTNGVTGTAMVAYSNLLGANNAVATSTVFRISFDQLPY
jgi:hypothetical protein